MVAWMTEHGGGFFLQYVHTAAALIEKRGIDVD